MAAQEDLDILQIDVKSAFLNASLEEEIYMEKPEGFVDANQTNVYKLLRAIYGINQASRAWHKICDKALKQW